MQTKTQAPSFTVSLRGYDRLEVDEYLDSLAEALGRVELANEQTRGLEAENERLRSRIADLERRILSEPPSGGAVAGERVSLILRAAEEAAADALARAREEAESMLAGARAEVAQAEDQARGAALRAAEEARRIEAAARAQAAEIIAEAESRASARTRTIEQWAEQVVSQTRAEEARMRAEVTARRQEAEAELAAICAQRHAVAATLTELRESLGQALGLVSGAEPIPIGEVTAGEVPAGDVPASEVPASEVPASEVPAGEVPAGEVPDRDGSDPRESLRVADPADRIDAGDRLDRDAGGRPVGGPAGGNGVARSTGETRPARAEAGSEAGSEAGARSEARSEAGARSEARSEAEADAADYHPASGHPAGGGRPAAIYPLAGADIPTGGAVGAPSSSEADDPSEDPDPGIDAPAWCRGGVYDSTEDDERPWPKAFDPSGGESDDVDNTGELTLPGRAMADTDFDSKFNAWVSRAGSPRHFRQR
jgi:DivIVA domain-containing protein